MMVGIARDVILLKDIKMIDITPYSKNAKKHPEKQLKQIAKSIKEFGWQQPIVVDKNCVIIVGHGRWFAYEKYRGEMNLPEPEIKVADLTEDQANAYRLADNKLNESEWDMGLAIEDLKGLSEEMFDLTGFDKDDLVIDPDIDFEDINSTEDREKTFKDQLVTCPNCNESFIMKV